MSHQLVRDTRAMARPDLHDPRVLRAIAHPVRNRILTELDASGPMRAADVAVRLGIPANQASFHLRQLAKFGLVEEDPEAARDKRDRVWKPTEEAGYNVYLSEIEKTPGGKAASAVFRRTQGRLGPPRRRRRPTATTGRRASSVPSPSRRSG